MAIDPAKIKNLARDPDTASIKTTLESLRTAVNQLRVDADNLQVAIDSLEATSIPSGSPGYVQFKGSTGALASSASFYWDNVNARLGVGTSAPSYTIHAWKTINCVIAAYRYNGAEARIVGRATEVYVGSFTNHPLRLIANNTAYCTLTTVGKMGVGPSSSSPSYELHVFGDAAVNGLKTATSHPTNYRNVFVDTDTGQLYSNSISGATPPPDCSGYVQIFCTKEIVSADNLYWDGTNDRLGIGTDKPAAELEINGDIIVKGLITPSGSNPGNAKIVFADPVTGKLFTR